MSRLAIFGGTPQHAKPLPSWPAFDELYKSDGTVSEPSASTDDAFVARLRYFVHCVAERQPPCFCPPRRDMPSHAGDDRIATIGGERPGHCAGR